jgi:hypothetical protein
MGMAFALSQAIRQDCQAFAFLPEYHSIQPL